VATPAAILSILVKADGVARASNEIRGLDADLDRTGKRGSKSLGLLKGAAAGLGAVAGFAALGGGVRFAVGEFEEARKVGALTNQVIKSTGGVANVSAKQVETLAGAISRKVGTDDEAIQSGANLLLTFKNVRNEAGKGRDIFNQATAAAVDLSAAGFGSLESTSKQLGKALNDPVKGMSALGRAGVTFSADQKKAIEALIATGTAADRVRAQQIILKEVQSQVGGAAAAQATPMDHLRVTMGNLAEKAGGVLVPAFDKAAKFLTALLNQMIDGKGIGGAIISVFGAVGKATGTLVGVVKDAVKWFGEHKTITLALAAAAGVLFAAYAGYTIFMAVQGAVVALRGAMLALNASFLANPVVLVVVALAALAAAFVVAYKKSETFREIVDLAFSVLKTAVVAVVGALADAVKAVVGFFSDVDAIPGKLLDAGKAIAGALVDGIKAIPGLMADAAKFLFTHLDDGIKAYLTGYKIIGSWVLDRIIDGVKTITGLLASVGGWLLNRLTDLIKASPGVLMDLGKWVLNRIVDGIKTITDLLGTVGGWLINRVVEFVKAAPEALVDVGSWVLNRVVDGFKTITDALAGAGGWLKNRLVEGIRALADAYVDLGGWILDKLIDGLKAIGSKVRDAVEWIKDKIVDAIKHVFKDALKIPLSIDLPKIPDLNPFGGAGNGTTVGPGNVGLLNSVQSIADYSLKWGLSGGRGHNQGYRPGDDGWHGQNRARDLSGPPATMLAFAKMLYDTMGPRLLELIYTPLGKGIKNGQSVGLSFPFPWADHYDHIHVAMQNGGYVKRAGWAVVGEKGPELAHLPGGTNVYSNKDSQGLLGGTGGPLVHIEHAEFGSRLEANAFAERMAFRIATAG
jgi:hypothetical protein